MDKVALESLESVNQIRLTDAEKEEFLKNYEKLESDFKALEEIDTENVEVMVHVMPMSNIIREDVEIKNFTREQLQESAPESYDGYWQVPRLVE